MAENEDWGVDLKDLYSSIRQVEDSLRALLDQRGGELDPALLDLALRVEKARDQAGNLFERLSARPVGLFFSGYLLSREQFLLLASRGAVFCSVPTTIGELTDPYDVFRMLHYEDAEQRCYISPNERPLSPGTVKIRFGRPPEEISWARLRPEQRKFFEQCMPEVANRFRRAT